jgi:hypothetical protein
MIIHDLDIECVVAVPAEANLPLVVDAYAVLPLAVTAQWPKLPSRHPLDRSEPAGGNPKVEQLRLPASERFDRGPAYGEFRLTASVKRGQDAAAGPG